jgi:hypothetical protein
VVLLCVLLISCATDGDFNQQQVDNCKAAIKNRTKS